MNIKFLKDLQDNKYSAQVSTEFTDQENDLITNFGEPQVDFGGSITGPPAYDLPSNYRAIKSGLPYTFSIDGDGDIQAKDKVLAWITAIRTRLLAAITSLRNKSDDFSGEIIETV